MASILPWFLPKAFDLGKAAQCFTSLYFPSEFPHHSPMRVPLLPGCILTLLIAEAALAEGPVTTSPSPNGKYALRLVPGDSGEASADIVEVKSGSSVQDQLESLPTNHIPSATLVWSADSHRVAYGYEPMKISSAQVFFWNGSKFEEITLPEDLPNPNLHLKGKQFTKVYADVVTPVRWLDSNALVLTHYMDVVSGNGEKTGTVTFTLQFDAKNHAMVKKDAKK